MNKEQVNHPSHYGEQDNYYEVISELESELKLTNEITENYTVKNLTLNLIEMAGYKRCLTTMINRFKEIERLKNKK